MLVCLLSNSAEYQKADNLMSRRWFKIGLTGTIVTAICCFTPLLVWLMAGLGMSAYLGMLDTFLLPLLGIFAAFTLIAYIKGRVA